MAQKKELQWKSVDPEFISWTSEGLQVVGKLTERDTININGRDITRYSINVDGEIMSFLTTAQLERKLHGVELGNIVRITYNGLVKGGAFGEYKDFLVEFAV
jgi:hypothetical protein